MRRHLAGFAILSVLALAAQREAQAAILFTDSFEGLVESVPAAASFGNWTISGGTVDIIVAPSAAFSIESCVGGAGTCIDLDGSTGSAGLMRTTTAYNLLAGTTYVLTAYLSGNQRSPELDGIGAGNPDDVQFGFLDSGTLLPIVGAFQTVAAIGPTSAFTQYTVLFTPAAPVSAYLFFRNTTGGDNIGPMLDNVQLEAVPLPPAAWLLLSGLVGLGAVSRRRRIRRDAEDAPAAS